MKNRLLTTLFVLLPFLVQAHGYWLELVGNGKPGADVTVKIFFGEYENNIREKGASLAGMKEFRAYVIDPAGQQQSIALTQTETCWEGRFKPAKSGHYQVFGVNDTRDVQDWTRHGLGVVRPIEYLRADYMAGSGMAAANAKPQTDLDVLARNESGQVVLTAFAKRQPLAKTKLTIQNPQGWEKTLTTDAGGVARFTPSGPGLYIVEAGQMDKTPGQYQGKDYPAIRTAYALTVKVD